MSLVMASAVCSFLLFPSRDIRCRLNGMRSGWSDRNFSKSLVVPPTSSVLGDTVSWGRDVDFLIAGV